MTAGAPWSVKGIDPKAREIAKDLARRSGMTLGEWLNRMIVEGEAPAAPDLSAEHAFDPVDAGPIVVGRESAAPRYEIPNHPADEVGKVADAIERLTARIEAAEQRSTLAISGIDQSVRGALARLEAAEREQVAVAARFEGALDDIRTEAGRTGDRLRRVEQEAAGPRSAEALRSLEGMLGKVAGQFYDGEARTREALAAIESRVAEIEKADPSGLVEAVAARVAERLEAAEGRTTDALRDLGASFVALDRRLKAVEAGGAAERLEALAADLTRRMEATRAELAAKLAESAEARFDRMDRRLSEMAQHVAAAETRSAQAIERVGREMVSMADNLSRRVQGVENRGADAIEQVGGEVARIAAAVEQKLNRADTAQAQALEKLGSEIARITERLAERIANSERRGALAIDEVGEQVARVTERITQRQERAATDLAERIRQSEERTARLLEEAREKIDASLNSSHRRLAEQAPPAAPAAPAAPPPVAARPAARDPFDDPFAGDPFEPAARSIPEDAFAPQAFARPPAESAPGDPAPFPTAERGPPSFSQEDFDAADGFAPLSDGPEIPDAPEIPAAPVIHPFEVDEAPQAAAPRSTRDVIEQARLAARAAGSAGSASLSPAESRAGGLFAGLHKKPKKRAGTTLQTLLIVTGVGAVFGVAAVGVVLSTGGAGGKPSPRVAEALRIAKADSRGEVKGAEADTTPRVAMAVAPGLEGGATPPPALAAAASGEAADSAATLYGEALRLMEAKDPAALDRLRRAANMGYAPAQFDLSKAYQSGALGLRKDEAESRRWTERAAQAGDPRAMHNLGLAFFHGSGGPMNKTTAAQWFRRAADLGMGDSQYNLASLHEQGFGVQQNAAEAYKWYLIAAKGGDAEARAAAERVKRGLTPEQRDVAEKSAAAFRPATPNPSARPATAAGGVASAQRALQMLGYYRGPQDGQTSAALKGAIQAFQRDKNLQPTGNLDGETMARLAVYAR